MRISAANRRAKGGAVTVSKKSARQPSRVAGLAAVPLCTLEISLIRGPVGTAFASRHPVISRTILIRADQTLADLHRAIFDAFDRREDRPYEFQFGRGPMDPQGPRYVLPKAARTPFDEFNPPAGTVTDTPLRSLGLEVGRSFCYWFDFGEDWWHQITVEGIDTPGPKGKYPRVAKRVGDSPSQDAAENQEEGDPLPDTRESVTADTACLIGELHLSKGDYAKAVEAFSRSIHSSPTADAHEGRAKAYRALAEADERRADKLRG
jgi:hypothetical protein